MSDKPTRWEDCDGLTSCHCHEPSICADCGCTHNEHVIDERRLMRALTAIHGDSIPLPNRPSAKEWAAIIADWYERDDPGHPGPHLRAV